MLHEVKLNKVPVLKDGGEWAAHEDCLIGNEQGIENLITACAAALDSGEYRGNDLGDFVGVKKLEDSWFEDPKDNQTLQIGNVVIAIILISLVGLVLIGGYTVVSWFL